MIPEAREVHLSRKDRKVLEATLQRDLKRARIVLLAADVREKAELIFYAPFFEPKPEEQPNLAPAVAPPKLTS